VAAAPDARTVQRGEVPGGGGSLADGEDAVQRADQGGGPVRGAVVRFFEVEAGHVGVGAGAKVQRADGERAPDDPVPSVGEQAAATVAATTVVRLILPGMASASKSGAVSLMDSPICRISLTFLMVVLL